MIRVATYAVLDDIPSADLNTWQDRTAGVFGHTSSGATNGFDGLEGADTVAFQLTVPHSTVVTIQASEDWRDRVLLKGAVSFPTAANQLVGGAADYLLNEPSTGPLVHHLANGYTGRGGNSNVGSGALVSPGNPPLNATGAFPSWAIRLTTHLDVGVTVQGPWVFAHYTSGVLQVYQSTGIAVRIVGSLTFSGATGLRP
jgi:hypothetical protein